MKIDKSIRQFLIYLVIGGLATIVEWAVFYTLSDICGVHYLVSTAGAFAVSTFANWLFGKWLLFKEKQNVLKELAKVYLASIVGLLMNLIIMFAAVDIMGFSEMLSKIAATGIVFLWNFLVRKLLIYKI